MKKKILVVLVALTLACSLLFSNLMIAKAAANPTTHYLEGNTNYLVLTVNDESAYTAKYIFKSDGKEWEISGEYEVVDNKVSFINGGTVMLTATIEEDGTWGFEGFTYITAADIKVPDTDSSENVQNPTQDTETPPENEDGKITMTKEELEQYITGLLEKLTVNIDSESYLKQNILPWIAGALADLVVVALFLFVPYMRNKARRKQIEGYAQGLKEDKENLTALLSSTDAPALKTAITELFGNYLDKSMENFKQEFGSYMKTFASIKTTIDTEYAQMKALIQAARQAWSSKPEVVAILAESPEKTTLELQAQENENLKNYIRSVKGEEADEIIKKLKVE